MGRCTCRLPPRCLWSCLAELRPQWVHGGGGVVEGGGARRCSRCSLVTAASARARGKHPGRAARSWRPRCWREAKRTSPAPRTPANAFEGVTLPRRRSPRLARQRAPGAGGLAAPRWTGLSLPAPPDNPTTLAA